jgi:hypothetical protein
VRLARLVGVEWLEAPGRAEQQPGRLGAALLVKGDLPARRSTFAARGSSTVSASASAKRLNAASGAPASRLA